MIGPDYSKMHAFMSLRMAELMKGFEKRKKFEKSETAASLKKEKMFEQSETAASVRVGCGLPSSAGNYTIAKYLFSDFIFTV